MIEGAHFDWTVVPGGHACQILTWQGGSPISYGLRVRFMSKDDERGASWGVGLHDVVELPTGFEIEVGAGSCMAHGLVHCPDVRAIEQTIGVAKLLAEHVVELLVESVRRTEGNVRVGSVDAEQLRRLWPARTVH